MSGQPDQISPIFAVRNLRQALDHYRSLGFDVVAHDGGDEYGFAARNGISLHLAADENHDATRGAGRAYLYVADSDALHAEWSRAGIGGTMRALHNTDYGLREGAHVDPDGNLIRFGSPLTATSLDERLVLHLEQHHGIQVASTEELDAGVLLIHRSDGEDWVARVFPVSRPMAAAAGDAAVLECLAAHDFPAERCATDEPVSDLDGRAVLVTEYVSTVPRNERRETIRELGGLRLLGELLGQLHTLEAGGGPLDRPGGAWHHLADGGPGDERAAAARVLADAERSVTAAERPLLESLRSEILGLDCCDGLPEALIHPDFVLVNVVASPDRGLVLVDWTGAGRGPRLWSLAFLLFAEGVKDIRRVDLVVDGYRRYVTPVTEELARLPAALASRVIAIDTWSFGAGRISLSELAERVARSRELAAAIATHAVAAFERSSVT